MTETYLAILMPFTCGRPWLAPSERDVPALFHDTESGRFLADAYRRQIEANRMIGAKVVTVSLTVATREV